MSGLDSKHEVISLKLSAVIVHPKKKNLSSKGECWVGCLISNTKGYPLSLYFKRKIIVLVFP